MARSGYVELFRQVDGRWRWRKVAANGRVTDNPGQGFSRKWSAKRSAEAAHPGLEVRVVNA